MIGGADPSAPLFHASVMQGESLSEAQHGAELFAANCASCHGVAADGKSEANEGLLPKAANLLGSRFGDERLSAVLWNGVYGSAMPAWREYSERDLRDLTVFVKHLPRSTDNATQLDTASSAKAQLIFVQNCASCHGEQGDGHGPAAGALAPAPTNFHIEQPTYETALNVLTHGVPGTAMPTWTSQLSIPDRQLLATYVRSFFGAPTLPHRSREQQVSTAKGVSR
jgi:mono/diheme cytochrome c family protein